MRRNRKAAFVLAAAVTAGTCSPSAQAATYAWTPTTGGNWVDLINWTKDGTTNPAPEYPNTAGDIVTITQNIGAGATITLPSGTAGATIGKLTLGDPDTTHLYTIASSPRPLNFDNGDDPAELIKVGVGATSVSRDSITANVVIPAATLVINADASDNSIANAMLQLRGQVSGGQLVKEGDGAIAINPASGNNTYNGLLIKAGSVRLEGGSNVVAVNGPVEIRYNTNLRLFGQNNPISNTSNIYIPRDAVAPNTDVGGTFGMGAGGNFNVGFAAGGNTDTSLDGSTFTTSAGTQVAVGSFESDAYGTQIGGANRGIVTFGGNNEDKTFMGRFIGRTSFVKVGTGVQTLSGPYNNSQTPTTSTNAPGGSVETPVAVFRHFKVLGGRVDLDKGGLLEGDTFPDDAVENPAAIAQTFLYIGDGTVEDANPIFRPEVKLLRSHQIEVQTLDLTNGTGITRSETTQARLNSGVLNLNGFSEEIQSIQVTQTGGFNRSTIALGDNGQLYLNGGLTVDAGAIGEITSTAGLPAVKTAGLTLDGVLDLQDNKLAVGGGDLATINGYVASGRNGGAWDGDAGIITSLTDAGPARMLTTIGVADAATAKDITGTDTATFGGQTVSPTDILAMYTYAGDSDLTGSIDGDDFAAIDAGYESNGVLTGYQNGDFDYSGTINADDYWLINANYSRQTTAFASGSVAGGVTAVPEPASLSLLAIGAASLLCRRRRN